MVFYEKDKRVERAAPERNICAGGDNVHIQRGLSDDGGDRSC